MDSIRIAVTAAIFAAGFTGSVAKAEIEAIKGKRYDLRPAHGPWMIMVASLRDVPEERRTSDGLSAWEAADALVFELRSRGIPAYTWLRNEELGYVSGPTQEDDTRRYIAQHESVAVLAGNFPGLDDEKAQIALRFIQEYEPGFMSSEKKSGGLFARTPGRPKPLSRAFMVPNPLRDQSDMKPSGVDPLVKSLNAGMEYSLLRNPGKYTLVIATMTGNSVMKVDGQKDGRAVAAFNEQFGTDIDRSGSDAWQLVQALRSASKLGYPRDYEAWVLHERYRSIVTVGSFDSPDDPEIARLARAFRGKPVKDPQTGEETVTAELFSIPRKPAAGKLPDRIWLFDVVPTLTRVPRQK